MSTAPKPGLYSVSETEYRAWEAVNQSTLWTFRRSAAHARHEFLHPSEPSHAKDLGSAIHAVLLEPASLERDYAVRPADLPTRGPGSRKALWAWKEEVEESGKIILDKRDDYETLEGIRDSLADHTLAFELLTSPGRTEVSAIWCDPKRDVLCKGRMDRIVEHAGWTWVVDVKSTTDASPQAFARAVSNFGYYLQCAFYLDGLKALSDRDRRFAIVAVEKSPPYAIATYELDMIFEELGREEYRRHLATWKECQRTGIWPGYPSGIETLEAPRWLESRLTTLEAA